MKTLPSPAPLFRVRLSLSLLAVAAALSRGAGAAHAQEPTLAEALDTPGLTWTGGSAAVVTGPGQTYDGVDAVRLDPRPLRPDAGGPGVRTDIPAPSFLTFRHRGNDLNGTARIRMTRNSAAWEELRATFWRETGPLLVLPGPFSLATSEGPGGTPLFLDDFRVAPAPEVSLGEAADAPGVVFTPGPDSAAAGVVSAADSPDGVDAVWFRGTLSASSFPEGMVAAFSGNAELLDRPATGHENNARARKVCRLPEGGGSTLTWRVPLGAGWSAVDQVTVTPTVPLAEALDAPGLTFDYPADIPPAAVPYGTTEAPPGAKGGHAVALPAFSQDGFTLRVFGFRGPGLLRFSSRNREGTSAWGRVTVPIQAGVTSHTWRGAPAWSAPLWLDEVSFTPVDPDIAAHMGQAGADVSLPFPEAVTWGPRPGDPGISVGTVPDYAGPAPEEWLRVSAEGPCLISFRNGIRDFTNRYSADGGGNIAFQGVLDYGGFTEHFEREHLPVFATVFSGAGPHRLSVWGGGFFNSLRVLPLVEVSLAEALDAPDMVFTTSPGAPWKGYAIGDLLGAEGGSAACGGAHPGAAADDHPWLETTVTGPGVLRFRHTKSARNGYPAEDSGLSVTVNGLTAPRFYSVEGEFSTVVVGHGPQTVRWTQSGANVNAATGALVWMDRLSYTPQAEPLSLGDALETGSARAWSAAGAVTPVLWPGGEADQADGALLHSAGRAATLSTTVKRPFLLAWKAEDVTLSVDGAPVTGSPQGPTGWTHREADGPPARVEFAAIPGRIGVLDTVAVFTEMPAAAAPGGQTGGFPGWTPRGGGVSWLENADAPESGVLFPPSAPRAEHYLEAEISGPFTFTGFPALLLPDRGMRRARGRVTFPGLNRVILAPADIGEPVDIARLPRVTPGIPLGEGAGAPDLPWETGGDVPWMGEAAPVAGNPPRAVSGTLEAGEHAWIQTEVEGPCVLRCRLDISQTGYQAWDWRDFRITVNGAPVPPSPSPGYNPYAVLGTNVWLHLPAGRQRVRWWFSVTGETAARHPAGLLSGVAAEPAPVPSWQEVTGLAALPFACWSTDGYARPWSELNAWTALQQDGRDVVRMNRNLPMIPVLPGPGVYEVTTLTNLTDPDAPGAPGPESEFAPHSWLPKSFPAVNGVILNLNGLHPAGQELLVDSAVWRPAGEVSLAEALDTPGVTWTAGSNGLGEWRGHANPGARGDADPDAARFLPEDPRAEAWMETTVTGPARVDITWSDIDPAITGHGPVRRDLPDFLVLVDGVEAVRGLSRTHDAAPPLSVHVPAGVHTLRLHRGPVTGRKTSAEISRVTFTPEAAGPNIGELVDAPDLPWIVTDAAAGPAEPSAAWDRVDAVYVNPASVSGATLATAVRGPGLFRVRVEGQSPKLNGAAPAADGTGYRLLAAAVPPGPRSLRIQAAAFFRVDEAVWRPLPELPAELAAAVLTPAPGAALAELAEGTVYTGFPEGTPTGLVIFPGRENALRLRLPAFSRLTFRATLILNSATAGDLIAGPLRYSLMPASPADLSFTSGELLPQDGRVTLRAEGGPALIRDLTISPYDGGYYLSWAERAGLNAVTGHLTADPDGDGVANALEHAFGMDPKKPDAGRSPAEGGGASFGLPEVGTLRAPFSGQTFLTVRFRARHFNGAYPSPVTYTVETAAAPGPGEAGALLRWTTAEGERTSTNDTAPAGWVDHLWRSAAPMTPGSRMLVRVRAYTR